MNFYTRQYKHYCGIDRHARAMCVYILDQHGAKLVHKWDIGSDLALTHLTFWLS
jgi:hypothetical protein